ncbi:hypothetical protein MRB53_037571 [Persea americana]|nr:hypothetical protein MRB53_037571 [Persea americana]
MHSLRALARLRPAYISRCLACQRIAFSASVASHTSRTALTRQAHIVPNFRPYSSKSEADDKIEEITELSVLLTINIIANLLSQVCNGQRRGRRISPTTLSIAEPHQFEMAMEETEKMTIYAEDDRAAARQELDKVEAAYNEIVDGADQDLGEEVRRRIGQRIRELSAAVKAMEELAQNQD